MRFRPADLVRTALGVPVALMVTGALAAYVSLVALVNPRSRQFQPIIEWWSRFCCRVGGLTWEVEGRPHLDPDKRYVFVANHQGTLDIPVHFLAIPTPIRFLAKKELYRIPVFGQVLKGLGMVRVDRQAHGSAQRQIEPQVDVSLERGNSIIVYAEGTRARDVLLRPFKTGAFHIAVQHGLDIVPVAIYGTAQAWPPGSKLIRGGHARVIIHPPVAVAGLGREDVVRLRDETRTVIETSLLEMAGRT